ncbi:hypothetical protein OQA88_6672 [Cercophora sp. LCS_1]
MPNTLLAHLILFIFTLHVLAANTSYVGYLISNFSDKNPTVQWYLSEGNDPSTYTFLNKGQPILESTVGTKAVRDVFLVTNSARNEWFMICTEDPTGGMLWAPSAHWDSSTSQYDLFWSTQLYSPADTSHRGTASLKRIRHATTKDFITFSAPTDYLAPSGVSIIDQEFLPLEQPGHYARFYKDETAGSRVVIEISTDGLFGTWKRVGNVRSEGRREGAAAFADNVVPGRYYVFLDDYTQYLPFVTENISAVPWGVPNWSGFPRGLKHGSVTALTREEYDAVASQYLA